MKRISKLCPMLVAFSVILVSCNSQHQTPTNQTTEQDSLFKEKVIYGDDNRRDIYEVTLLQHRRLAKSTVALIRSHKVTSRNSQVSDIKATVYGDEYGLCKSEPYYSQPNAAYCSGFLVAPNIIVTAGHCVGSQNECENTKFVFDYAVYQKDEHPNQVPSNSVYGCKKLVHSEVASSGSDFAVIELDRAVNDRDPLAIRQSGAVVEDDPLLVIGHPAGLPTKVADGAAVRKIKSAYFSANLDTYGGNSGSAVFNELTGEVEGILVRGEVDFTYKNGCRVSNECTDGGCRGEDVTKITNVLSYLPETPDVVEVVDTDYVIDRDLGGLEIPDNSASGVVVELGAEQAPLGRQVEVSVNISHSWRGDLTLKLLSPQGDVYTLQSRTGGNRDDIIGTYILQESGWQIQSGQQLSSQQGVWKLKVSDHARWDVGKINSVALKFVN